MRPRLAAGLALAFLTACPPPPPDGDDAGPPPDAGVDDAGTGLPDAGRCQPFDAGDAFPALSVLAPYCAAVERGARHEDLGPQIACGAALRAEDEGHLGLLRPRCDTGTLGLELRQLEAAVGAGRLRFDAAALDACRALGRAGDAGSPRQADGGLVVPCDRVLVPLVPEGGACDRSEECTGGLFCRPAGTTSCGGTCTRRLGLLAACAPDTDLCDDGLFCAADGQCRARQSAGPCDDSQACLPGYQCVRGQCAPAQAEGGPCDATGASTGCGEGLRCAPAEDGGTATCRAPAGSGEACAGRGCASPCDRCSPDAGTCVARGAVGAPCATHGECLPGLECGPLQQCTPRPRTGEACRAGGERGNCLYEDELCVAVDGGAVCAASAAVGGDCGVPPAAPSCAPGSYCAADVTGGSGRCALLPRVGQRCGNGPGLSSTCEGAAFCDVDGCTDGQGLCRPRRLTGEACVASAQCASDTCVAGRCALRCNDLQRVGCAGGLLDQLGFFAFFGGLVLVRRRKVS